MPDRSRLSSTVWAKETENLSLIYRECEIEDTSVPTVVSGQVLNFSYAQVDIPPQTLHIYLLTYIYIFTIELLTS